LPTISAILAWFGLNSLSALNRLNNGYSRLLQCGLIEQANGINRIGLLIIFAITPE